MQPWSPLKIGARPGHHPRMNRYRTWIWVTLIAIAAFVIDTWQSLAL